MVKKPLIWVSHRAPLAAFRAYLLQCAAPGRLKLVDEWETNTWVNIVSSTALMGDVSYAVPSLHEDVVKFVYTNDSALHKVGFFHYRLHQKVTEQSEYPKSLVGQ
jgi:hypothetical protein